MALGKFLTVDPGEDTGWSVWDNRELADAGTEKMWTFSDQLWLGHFDAHPTPSDVLEPPTPSDDLYLAGLLDGEAFIGVQQRSNKAPQATIKVGMVTRAPLDWAAARYGGSVGGPYTTTHQDQYSWYVSKQTDVFHILDRVFTHLKVKQQAATECLTHLSKGDTRFNKRSEPLDLIVCEDWRLYPWVLKTGALDFDECRTARLIGSITAYCRLHGTQLDLQPARIKERAIAAGAESYFSHPLRENRHANDAIMHGVFRNAIEAGAAWTDLSQTSWDS